MTLIASSNKQPPQAIADRWIDAGMNVAGWIGRAIAVAGSVYRARQATHALARLDDHMLRDIGIVRTQIELAARDGRP